jgi:cysteine desulfurase/selenocysteine lyase
MSRSVAASQAATVKARLAGDGVDISVSRAPSTRLDREDRGLSELLRASVQHYNPVEEITALIRAVRACARA